MATSTTTKPAKTAKSAPRKETVVIPGEGTIDFTYDTSAVDSTPAIDFRPQSSSNDNLIASAMALAVVGVIGALSYFGWKGEQERQAELDAKHKIAMDEMAAKRKEREAWFESQRTEGKIVIETADGHYMAIPAEAYAKSESRKKAL